MAAKDLDSTAAKTFRDFELEGWQVAAKAYHTAFGPLTSQVIEPLLVSAGVTRETRLLDLASGPGYVAAAAAARGAHVTGTDFSHEMVALAKHTHPGVEFREADAEALPFDDATFDAVTMSFLLGHLTHPDRALAEARRVLRPGGRFACAWWTLPDRAIGFGIVLESIRKHGRLDVALPPGPPFEAFSDPKGLEDAIRAAGFDDVRVTTVPMTWTLDGPEELYDAYYFGTVRTAGLLREQTPEAREVIRASVILKAGTYDQNGRIELPMPALVASGVRR